MTEELRSISATPGDLKKFAVVLAVACFVVALLKLRAGSSSSVTFIAVGVGIALVGWWHPSLLVPFYKLWMGFAVIASWVMTRVILALVFYCIVTPLAAFSRLFGKKFLDLKLDPTIPSYWSSPEDMSSPENAAKQF